MQVIARRGFLKALLGIGAATVCGFKASEALAETAAPGTAKTATAVDGATEATEAALEPNQFYFVRRRRRRFYRRRRIIFFRPRRRFIRVRRYRRFRRW